MIKPTGTQISAARALVRWSKERLAHESGLSLPTIRNMENESKNPQQETMGKVITALEKEGVEFIGDRGVALRHDIVTVYEGANYYIRFLEDVRQKAFEDKREILFFHVDDSISSPNVVKINQRMIEDGISCRYLCSEKPKKILMPKELYRGIPQSHFRNGLQVVYGNYLATSVRGKMILVICNEDVAESARNLFDLIWQNSKSLKVQYAE